MLPRRLRVVLLAGGFLLPLLAGSNPAAAQTPTVVQGTVYDATTGSPLPEVRITIDNSNVQSTTDARGTYRLVNVPAGSITIRARRIGYKAVEQTTAPTASSTTTLDFRLSPSVVVLEEIITSGTAGEQSRLAQAASVAQIGVNDINLVSPVSNLNTILQSRVPGVSVLGASGTSGTSGQIRVRGSSSISLSNEPIIYIDGVRVSAGTKGPGVGGQLADRLSEIDPADIESIDLVKGPAAATLYGADASTGVISITTRRGRIGVVPFTQTVTFEYNNIDPDFTPPANFANCTAASVAPTSTNPLCRGQAVGTLVNDNPAVREGAFRDGDMIGLGWNGRGGGQNYGYFGSLNWDNEDGTTPNNGFDRQSGRFNFNWLPSEKLRIDATFGINKSITKLPDNDNNVFGFLGGSLLGSPLTRSDNGSGNNGWFGFQRDVDAISSIENSVRTHRTLATITANWDPFPWFNNRLTVGGDLLRDETRRFFPISTRGSFQGTTNTGSISELRVGIERLTFDYLGNIRRELGTTGLAANISFGSQVIDTRTETVTATGLGLTVSSARVVSSASSTSGAQGFARQRQVGFLGQFQLGWNDSRFIQLAARWDGNSAFGNSSEFFFLPKVGASWVLSNESFWNVKPINSLRVRAAYGTTGRAPNPGAALTTLAAAPFINGNVVAPGAVPANPGNSDLEAERGTELELGFEVGFFNERAGVEFTYFNKVTEDLLLAVPLPPSLGFTQNPFRNIGEVENRGVEVLATAVPISSKNLRWDVQFGFSTLRSRVNDLGEVAPFGTVNRVMEGFQPGAWVTNKIRDINTTTGVVTVSDTLEFAGNILPTFEGNISTNVTLFNRIRLFGLLDRKSGHKVRNFTDFFRETQLVRSDNRLDPDKLPLEERLCRFGNPNAGSPAFVTEGLVSPSVSKTVNDVQECYIQDASFWRLRELSATYTLASSLAGRLGMKAASITLAGQNLAIWTPYEGFDPEVVSAAAAQFNRDDFLTVPPSRRFVIRVQLTY